MGTVNVILTLSVTLSLRKFCSLHHLSLVLDCARCVLPYLWYVIYCHAILLNL
jgi:hypothetical protein